MNFKGCLLNLLMCEITILKVSTFAPLSVDLLGQIVHFSHGSVDIWLSIKGVHGQTGRIVAPTKNEVKLILPWIFL